jgi:hypothetical protein
MSMKFTADRSYSDPEKAARKLLEVQDGRIHIKKINALPVLGARNAGRI